MMKSDFDCCTSASDGNIILSDIGISSDNLRGIDVVLLIDLKLTTKYYLHSDYENDLQSNVFAKVNLLITCFGHCY